MTILEIFNVIIPVIVIIIIGVIVGKCLKVDTKPISDLCLYVFSPALFFHSVVTSQLNLLDLGRIALFAFVVLGLFDVLVRILGAIFKTSRSNINALLLASSFPNSGNYGLPIIMFAFGQAGVAVAIIYMVVQSFLMNSVGVFYASQSAENGAKKALMNILKMPGFTAIILAILIKIVHFQVPESIMDPIELLGQAAIPTLLTLLGVTLSTISINKAKAFISLASAFKLMVFPCIALLVIDFFYPFDSLPSKVLILEAATPTAATATLLSIKFDMKSEYVSSALFFSTLLSMVTIPLLLFIL
ncbi:AEC family transporter [Tuberibacillus sp. Marseille-P3662]|uniref:AEC family transporter n=1 Tax=Tuberibacillus sp. Marseille-P3662 TaxID=1965358 RepID=UPI000A1CDBF9|nr:AEC family transporter [Tuberibacillus sp. Marseille-P3662]